MDSHPDREIWLDSYREEKHGIESLNTYQKITLGEYCALHEKKGAYSNSYYVHFDY